MSLVKREASLLRCCPTWLLSQKARLFRMVRPYTMLSRKRLSTLYDLAGRCDQERIAGAFVECGVWKGGSAAVLCKRAGVRPVWLFDSFQGCPEPTAEDVNWRGRRGAKGEARGALQDVLEILRTLRTGDQAKIVIGYFAETVRREADQIGAISLLHLDADWYESTKTCLEHLYPLVAPGGFVVVDDYGHWWGCQKAMDEYLAARGESPNVNWSDHTGVWWRK